MLNAISMLSTSLYVVVNRIFPPGVNDHGHMLILQRIVLTVFVFDERNTGLFILVTTSIHKTVYGRSIFPISSLIDWI